MKLQYIDSTFLNEEQLPILKMNYDMDSSTFNVCYPNNENDRKAWVYDNKGKLKETKTYNSLDSSLTYEKHIFTYKDNLIKSEVKLFRCAGDSEMTKKEFFYSYDRKGFLKKIEHYHQNKKTLLIKLDYKK